MLGQSFFGTPTTYEVVPCVGPCGMRGDGPACEYCDHKVRIPVLNREAARRHLAAEGIVK